VLVEVPAAAKMAAAKAAHVASAKAAKVAAAKAAGVAAAEPAEVAATELAAAEAASVAEVSAGEMSPAAVESEAVVVEAAVVEAAPSDEDRTTKPVAIVVIRIRVSVTIVVAGAIIRPIVVIAAVRIAGRGAGDHPVGDGRARIVAVVGVAVAVSPNVVAMACVATRDIPMACLATRDVPVQAVRDPRVSSVPVMVSDSRRIRGGKRRRQHQSGRAKRESRNSKSAKSHGDIPFRLATQQRRGNAPFTSDRSALLTDKIQDDHDSARSSLPQLSKPKTAKKALKLKFRMEGSQLEYSERAHS
jgi:hypothetical protein